jgi:hypothetical protein
MCEMIEVGVDKNSAPAIAQQTSAKHAEANLAFSRSEAAGTAEASAYLGQAQCYGWAMAIDTRHGQAMIDDAIRRDPRLAAK